MDEEEEEEEERVESIERGFLGGIASIFCSLPLVSKEPLTIPLSGGGGGGEGKKKIGKGGGGGGLRREASPRACHRTEFTKQKAKLFVVPLKKS